MKQPKYWQQVSGNKWRDKKCHYGVAFCTLNLHTETVTISSRRSPDPSNYWFERQHFPTMMYQFFPVAPHFLVSSCPAHQREPWSTKPKLWSSVSLWVCRSLSLYQHKKGVQLATLNNNTNKYLFLRYFCTTFSKNNTFNEMKTCIWRKIFKTWVSVVLWLLYQYNSCSDRVKF